MTYRLDSDLPRPYGWFEKLDEKMRVLPPRATELPYKWLPYDDSWIREDLRKGNMSQLRKLVER